MTTPLQRLHDEIVRRHYATTTRESYLKIAKTSTATPVDDSIVSGPMTSGATGSVATPLDWTDSAKTMRRSLNVRLDFGPTHRAVREHRLRSA